MKKFEDELQKAFNEMPMFASFEKSRAVFMRHFKDWVSPEDYQNTVASNKSYEKSNRTLSEENAKFVVENIELQKQIAELKSQLKKQQPEIPGVVAEWIKYWKSSGRGVVSIGRALTQGDNLSDFDKIHSWLSEYYKKYDEKGNEIIEDRNGVEPPNVTLFTHAWLYGYTVAKEKRFYLKNKLTGRALYYQNINGEKIFNETGFESRDKYSTFNTRFTQQEIDSMEIGSYEQVEVEE